MHACSRILVLFSLTFAFKMRPSLCLWLVFVTVGILIAVTNCAPVEDINGKSTDNRNNQNPINLPNLPNSQNTTNIKREANDTGTKNPLKRVRWDQIKLLDEKNVINPDGSYEYRYSLQDGTEQEAKGTLKEVNGTKIYTVKGFYGLTYDDGTQLEVEYEADENGFRVTSVKQYSDDRTISPKAIGILLGG